VADTFPTDADVVAAYRQITVARDIYRTLLRQALDVREPGRQARLARLLGLTRETVRRDARRAAAPTLNEAKHDRP
jgi:hypothetical protein